MLQAMFGIAVPSSNGATRRRLSQVQSSEQNGREKLPRSSAHRARGERPTTEEMLNMTLDEVAMVKEVPSNSDNDSRASCLNSSQSANGEVQQPAAKAGAKKAKKKKKQQQEEVDDFEEDAASDLGAEVLRGVNGAQQQRGAGQNYKEEEFTKDWCLGKKDFSEDALRTLVALLGSLALTTSLQCKVVKSIVVFQLLVAASASMRLAAKEATRAPQDPSCWWWRR